VTVLTDMCTWQCWQCPRLPGYAVNVWAGWYITRNRARRPCLSAACRFVVVAIRELCYTRKCFIQCACCCAACSCCRPAESDLVQAQVQLPPADMEAGAAAAKKAAGRAAAYAVPTGQRM
jgi:hypothetical protein